MTRLAAILIMATVHFTAARGFGWSQRWIHASQASRGTQLWFVGSLTLPSAAQSVRLEAASNGRFIVYVNGYNTTTDVLAPYAMPTPTLRGISCDATPFIDGDTCRIAVLYSPYLEGFDDRQLSLTLYGTLADGSPFAYSAGSDWSWTEANATTAIGDDESESVNGRNAECGWPTGDMPWPSRQPVVEGQGYTPVEHYRPQYIRHTMNCRMVHSSPTSLTFLPPRPFRGWVRVTLRGMRAGTTISVNGLSYTCSGQLDEQACRRFTIPRHSTQDITIVSPSGIKRSNVTSVEALDIDY